MSTWKSRYVFSLSPPSRVRIEFHAPHARRKRGHYLISIVVENGRAGCSRAHARTHTLSSNYKAIFSFSLGNLWRKEKGRRRCFSLGRQKKASNKDVGTEWPLYIDSPGHKGAVWPEWPGHARGGWELRRMQTRQAHTGLDWSFTSIFIWTVVLV